MPQPKLPPSFEAPPDAPHMPMEFEAPPSAPQSFDRPAAMIVPPIDPRTWRTQMPGRTMSEKETMDYAAETVPLAAGIAASMLTPVGWGGALAGLARLGPTGTLLMKGAELGLRGAATGVATYLGTLWEQGIKAAADTETAPKSFAEANKKALGNAAWGAGMEVGVPLATAAVSKPVGWAWQKFGEGAIQWAKGTKIGQQIEARVKALSALDAKSAAFQKTARELDDLVQQANKAKADELGRLASIEEQKNVASEVLDQFGKIDAGPSHAARAANMAKQYDDVMGRKVTALYKGVEQLGGSVDLRYAAQQFVKDFNSLPRGSNLVYLLNQPTADMAQAVKVGAKGITKVSPAAPAPRLYGEAGTPSAYALKMPESVDEGQRLSQLIFSPGALANQPLDAVVQGRGTLSAWANDPRFTPAERDILKKFLGNYDTAIENRLSEVGPEAVGMFRAAKNLYGASEEIKKDIAYKVMSKDPKSVADLIEPGRPKSVARILQVMRETGNEALIPVTQRQVLNDIMVGRNGAMDLGAVAGKLDAYGASIPALFRNPADLAQVNRLRQISMEVKRLEASAGAKSSAALDRLNRELADLGKRQAKVAEGMQDVNATRLAMASGQSDLAPEAMRTLAMAASHKVGFLASVVEKPLVEKILEASGNPARANKLILGLRKMRDFSSEDGPNMIRAALMVGKLTKAAYGGRASGEAIPLASSH